MAHFSTTCSTTTMALATPSSRSASIVGRRSCALRLSASGLRRKSPLVQSLAPRFKGSSLTVQRGGGATAVARSPLVVTASVEGEPLRAYDGCQLAVHYTGTAVETGTTIQTTLDRQEGPMIYTLGAMKEVPTETPSARIMAQMDIALLGMKEGGTKKFRMTPEEAYGVVDPQLVRDLPMEAVREALGPVSPETLPPGSNIQLPNGQTAKVVGFLEEVMRVDLNHPLAGLNVEFELTVMEVAEPGQLLESQKDMKVAKVKHILVEEEEKCNLIKEQILQGADFETMATANSTCPSSKDGGALGTFQEGQMVPEFDKVVFDPQTPLGQVAGPVKTQFGYHLILVEERTVP